MGLCEAGAAASGRAQKAHSRQETKSGHLHLSLISANPVVLEKVPRLVTKGWRAWPQASHFTGFLLLSFLALTGGVTTSVKRNTGCGPWQVLRGGSDHPPGPICLSRSPVWHSAHRQ